MKNQRHSRHWETILGKESVLNWLQKIVRYGGVIKRQNAGSEQSLTTLMCPGRDSDVNVLTILAEHNGANKFVSAYPYIKTGTVLRGKIIRIETLNNRVEAIVTMELEPGFEISFFATDYHIHESYYNNYYWTGGEDKYEVSLAALAYTCDFEDEKRLSFSFSGDTAEKIRMNFREESGNEAPIYFDCLNMTMLCHMDGESKDDYSFQSKIRSIETVDIMGIPMLRIEMIFDTFSGKRIYLPIYVSESKFKENEKQKLKEEQVITGRLWMQGHLNKIMKINHIHIYDEYDFPYIRVDNALSKAWTIFHDRMSECTFSGVDSLCPNFSDIIEEMTDLSIQTSVVPEDFTQRKTIDVVCEIRRDSEIIYNCAILLQFIKDQNTLKGIYDDLQFLENIRLKDDIEVYSECRFYLVIPFGRSVLLFVEISGIEKDNDYYYGRLKIVFSNEWLADEHKTERYNDSSLDAEFRIPKYLLKKLTCDSEFWDKVKLSIFRDKEF